MNDIFMTLNRLGAETDDALERFLGDEEMYMKYIRGFPDEPSMEALIKSMEARDYLAAEKAVHALKGIVNNLGFLPLADAAVDMLEELRANELDEALDAFEDVKKEYQLFTNAIVKWRAAS